LSASGRKTLVTGAGGFIGSHLVERLVADDVEVKAFIHYRADGGWGWLEDSPYKSEIEFVVGDIRDFDAVHRALAGCREVFHLAALVSVPYSAVSPLAYLKTNVEGTYNVLQSALVRELEDVIITSTCEVYGAAAGARLLEESAPVGARSPYAASKIAADELALSFHRTYGLPVKIARPFNAYGPRQSARAVIPAIMIQVLSGHPCVRLGNLRPVRDLTFVSDTVRGFVKIAGHDVFRGGVTHIGTSEGVSVAELVALIGRVLGTDVSIEEDPERMRPASEEVDRLVCDGSRLRGMTLWRPEYSLQRGIEETVAWFKGHIGRYKPGVYQI
jgi:NAD dependent epimerase/dehydratase